jgi:NitT/TauT family transport system substrate-binding protein
LKVGTVLHPACEFLFLARETGLLQIRETRLVEMVSRADNMRLVEEGALDAAVLSLDEFFFCRVQRPDLRIVAVLGVSDGADALMTRPGLNWPEQLRGRRIVVVDPSTGMVVLEAALAAASLRQDEVMHVPVTAEQALAQFRAGGVDAVVAAEPWVSQFEALGAERVFDSTRLPDRLLSVLAVRSQSLQAQPETVRRLVTAHWNAVDQFQRDPQGACRLMAPRLRLHNEPFPLQEPSVEQLALSFRGQRSPLAAAHRALLRPGGPFDLAQQALQLGMVTRKQLARVAPLQDVLDTRFLPQA